jgi:transglutaminase-like putative cysteine protease
VNADATYSVLEERVLRVVSEEGLRIAGQALFEYSESLQQMEVLSAYTLKKDGTRIDVPAASIYTRDHTFSRDAPIFSDYKLKVIVFPNVAPGDKVVHQVRTTQISPLFPGHFSMVQTFGYAHTYEDVRISVSVPAGSLPLYADAVGFAGGKLEDQEGRSRWEWTAKNLTLPPGAARLLDGREPYVIVSSFKDYAALAAAYRERAESKAVVSDNIKALADELTAGISEPRAQARALYNWVSRNIRYVAVFLGAGGVVPHEA